MPKIISLSLLLFFCLKSFSQQVNSNNKTDTAFALDIFKDDNEKQFFRNIAAGQEIDFLTLFVLSDPTFSNQALDQYRSRIKSFITTANIDGKKKDLKSKDLKKIYTDVHDAFLTRFVANPSFNQLFINGEYNCATATALYTLLLDQLSLTYAIREKPTHVYLVASPESLNVMFETTAPGMQFIDLTEKAKSQYLEYLYKNKMISKEEWATDDKKELFAKYYYSDELINKRQLAGLLYYNRGVDAGGNENYKEAYKNFEKAYFLYPSRKLKYFVSISLSNLLQGKGIMENENAYPYFLRFLHVNDKEAGKGMLLEYMEQISKKLLFTNPNPEKYKTLYRSVIENIDDSDLHNKMVYQHYYNTAHYFDIKGKHDSSLLYLDSVYALNKNDLLVQELITGTLAANMSLIRDEKVGLDTMDVLFKRYSFIDKDSKLWDFYAYCLSKVMSKNFEKDKFKEGAPYLAIMKQMIEQQPDVSKRSGNYFIPALLEVYYYYLRRTEYKQAKAFLVYVDKYYPGEDEVKKRMLRIDDLLKSP